MNAMLLLLRSSRAFRPPTTLLPLQSSPLLQWKHSATLPVKRFVQGQTRPFAVASSTPRNFRTITTATSKDGDGNNGKRTTSKNSSNRTEGGRGGGGQRRNNNRRRRNNRPPPPPLPTTPGSPGRGCFRELITPGLDVWVIQKEHQRSGQQTRGEVQRLLTKSPYHPRGIKVMLHNGQVGRVIRIASE